MNNFIVPCGSFVFVFMAGFGFCCWYFKHRYIAPLEWRIRRLENQLRGAVTTTQIKKKRSKPMPTHIKYIPLESRVEERA
jgi:hypothetical protein